jgi:hypothetical protein
MKGFEGLLSIIRAENSKIVTVGDIETNKFILKFKYDFTGAY